MSSAREDLAGVWEFAFDPNECGLAAGWTNSPLGESVALPGSLDERGKGIPNDDDQYLGGLSRRVTYTGSAWFSREVEIPPEWAGLRLTLHLERVHWTSDVWVDGRHVGSNDSLSTPHRYGLGAFSGGKIRLTIRVDNTPSIPIGRISHALTDWTQTNWNGIVGDIRLEAGSPSSETVTIRTAKDRLYLAGCVDSNEISLDFDGPSRIDPIVLSVAPGVPFDFDLSLKDVISWSDEEPALYDVCLKGGSWRIERRVGFRSFEADGKQFTLNGSPCFLRGTLECCVFPKTGYPPTDVAGWSHVMGQTKAFGLNHLRFHSYCPPEAAFVAADAAGVLLQVELPLWTAGWPVSSDDRLLEYCRREAYRILAAYGHHPSFVLMNLGNELAFFGEEPKIDLLIHELKRFDPHRLYNFSAHGTHLSSACDYYVQADNGKPGAENRPLRGSTWFGVGSRFDRERPGATATCSEAASEFDRPVISHEVAEWAVFPDVHRADCYDGVLDARNFRAIARQLEARGMLASAPEFVRASGSLSARLYKEEIETLLRTDGLAGYQLLGLTDFPGQGTATVGMLDSFWIEKGFIGAAEFSEFCSSTVPILSFEKFVWSTNETFSAEACLFSTKPVSERQLDWKLVDESGTAVRSGTLERESAHGGARIPFGNLTVVLASVRAPAKYTLIVEGEKPIRNRWPLWIYPPDLPIVDTPELLVSKFYLSGVRDALAKGCKVWLRLDPNSLWGSVPGRFAPAFWSPIHFKEQVGTMGTLIEASHPALAEFPTDDHTDWQWWDVLTASRGMVLNDMPSGFRPLLQVIDRYERNHKLGAVWEARVGQGRLFVTAIDFERRAESLVVRQLEHSVRRYLASDRFEPSTEISFQTLDAVMRREP